MADTDTSTQQHENTKEERHASVLVIVTGGTISMKNENGIYIPDRGYLSRVLETTPVLHDLTFSLGNLHSPNVDTTLGTIFVLPKLSATDKRVIYCLHEYEEFIDSCNMTMNDYKKLAQDIKSHYFSFDGFVILHGTDTMAYTSSYLSFMLENLGKTVVLTGAQVPLCAARSDGVDNLLGALLVAGNYIIPEVTLFFHYKLYRGNRVRKADSHSFSAFQSPNLGPLLRMGVEVTTHWDLIWKSFTVEKFEVCLQMEENVGLLRFFPGMTAPTVKAFLSPPMKGVVLQTYGTGNGPSNREDLINELKKASERGVLLINCTQCHVGTVTGSYETGKVLEDAGVVQGYDMTPEAALAKLSYVLGKDDITLEKKKKQLVKNLRGELTIPHAKSKISRDNEFFEAIFNALKVSENSQKNNIRKALLPPLLCHAAKNNDLNSIKTLVSQGADIRFADYDGRTCLHVAVSEGNLEVANFLLGDGASVYAKDRFDNTPLEEAVNFKRFDCIRLLVKAGAHLNKNSSNSVEKICALVASSDLAGIRAWNEAGADLNSTDRYSRTALHYAALNDSYEIAEFLLNAGVDFAVKDKFGKTAVDISNGGTTQLIERVANSKLQS